MICKNCGVEVSDGAKFCQSCGSKVEDIDTNRFCISCGNMIKADEKFCSKCGKNISNKNENEKTQLVSNIKTSNVNKSIVFTAIGTIISLLLRLFLQREYIFYLGSNTRRAMGISGDVKAFLMLLPIAAFIIAVFMVVNNKIDDKRKKINAMIVNIILLALSLLFIGFDITYSLW